MKSASQLFDRLPGYTGPLSERIVTDGIFFEPPTEDRLRECEGRSVCIVVNDGRIFGGKDFILSPLHYPDEGYVRVQRDPYLGGGWAKIPVDEILGIRLAY